MLSCSLQGSPLWMLPTNQLDFTVSNISLSTIDLEEHEHYITPLELTEAFLPDIDEKSSSSVEIVPWKRHTSLKLILLHSSLSEKKEKFARKISEPTGIRESLWPLSNRGGLSGSTILYLHTRKENMDQLHYMYVEISHVDTNISKFFMRENTSNLHKIIRREFLNQFWESNPEPSLTCRPQQHFLHRPVWLPILSLEPQHCCQWRISWWVPGTCWIQAISRRMSDEIVWWLPRSRGPGLSIPVEDRMRHDKRR